MAAKIVVHVAIEITDDGKVCLQRGSWSLARGEPRGGQIQLSEITAIAQAFVSVNSPHLAEPPEGDGPLINTPTPLQLELGPSAAVRGQRLTDQGPPSLPPAAAGGIEALMAAGVTAILAKQLVAQGGNARAKDVAQWIRTKENVRDPDALAKKLFAPR